jgi:hypothetical protein
MALHKTIARCAFPAGSQKMCLTPSKIWHRLGKVVPIEEAIES